MKRELTRLLFHARELSEMDSCNSRLFYLTWSRHASKRVRLCLCPTLPSLLNFTHPTLSFSSSHSAANTGHHFYVDLRGPTPKSTWEHPASDYPAEPSRDSIEAESTDEDDRHLPPPSSSSNQNRTTASSTSTSSKPPPTGLKKFGRNIKDKMTGSTHEERKAKRKQREEEERRAYQQHVAIRQAIMKAAQTGQPQLLGELFGAISTESKSRDFRSSLLTFL